jgi:hypothetical protein
MIHTDDDSNVNDDDNENNIEISEVDDIIPITNLTKKTNSHKSNNTNQNNQSVTDIDILSKSELFKHLKVEELRKLAIAKLNITEDEVKKLKKTQLIQRLTQ